MQGLWINDGIKPGFEPRTWIAWPLSIVSTFEHGGREGRVGVVIGYLAAAKDLQEGVALLLDAAENPDNYPDNVVWDVEDSVSDKLMQTTLAKQQDVHWDTRNLIRAKNLDKAAKQWADRLKKTYVHG